MSVTTESETSDGDTKFIEEIVDAASACFRRFGVRKTTIGDIAETLGVHRPRIYRYFRDKDELITAVIIREFRALSAHRAAMFPVRGPVGPLITKVLIAGLERLGEDEFLSQVMSGDYTSLTLGMLVDNEQFLEAEREWWLPVIAHGRKRGEIRADLGDDEIIAWFLLQQVTAFERNAMFSSQAKLRAHVQRFVVGAVLSNSAR